MNEEEKQNAASENDSVPDYLKEWPGLFMREGDKIVEALPEDIAVARGYPGAKDKGEIVGGQRLTLLTKKNRYRLNEEVRVIHVMETPEPGHRIFVMGPKTIYGEYVDGKPATPETPVPQIYDGAVLDSPGVDYNYDITTYSFSQPGHHQIYWQLGNLRSNTLDLDIVANDTAA